MATLRWVLTLVLAGVFTWSSALKIFRPIQWTADVRRYRLPQPVKRVTVLAVPWVELAVAVLLLTGHTRVGAAIALLAFVVFSFAIVRLHRVLASNTVPCGCLGSTTARDYRGLLARNAGLAAAATVLVAFAPTRHGWALHAAWNSLTMAGAVVALTAAALLWSARYILVLWSRGDDGSLRPAQSQ
jgi:uncharacterized membrane protein YphA (DoxX/SURF4 family)